MNKKEECKVKLETELAFFPKPDMTAFLNVALPDSSDDRVDAYLLPLQSLTIRKPWWLRFKRWFVKFFSFKHP